MYFLTLAPPILILPIKNDDEQIIYRNVSDNIEFECQFRGQPKPTISWFHENTLLPYETEKISLNSLKATQEGEYTCKGNNQHGSDEYKFSLTVNCK